MPKIRKKAKAHKHRPAPRDAWLADYEVDLVLQDVAAGDSYRTVAAKFGISVGAVANYVSGLRRAKQ